MSFNIIQERTEPIAVRGIELLSSVLYENQKRENTFVRNLWPDFLHGSHLVAFENIGEWVGIELYKN